MQPVRHPDEPPPPSTPEADLGTPAELDLGRLALWCLISLAIGQALSAAHAALTQWHPEPGVILRWLTTATENPVRTSMGIGLLWYAITGWPGPPRGGKWGGITLCSSPTEGPP